MTSNQKWMLHGALSLAVVLSAVEVRAQQLETPGSPAAEAAAASASSASGPAGFGDGGQFVLSAERLFGYNWTHSSANGGSSSSTFSILGNPFGVFGNAYPYDWPRLGFDYFVTKSISAGIAGAFARNTANSNSLNAYQIAPRVGYGMMVGPWLGVWPRAGITYVGAPNQSYLGLTIDLAAVITVAQHFAITFAPVANIGLSGTNKPNGVSVSDKLTTLGVEFGLAIPF
jgi:hypothetical protein